MALIPRIVDACIFIGCLSAGLIVLLGWVTRDPTVPKAKRLSPASWSVIAALTAFTASGTVGAAACLWGLEARSVQSAVQARATA